MSNIKRYLFLHLCILIFTLTEIFGKYAAITYKAQGLQSIKLYIYLSLMLFVCLFYAFCWQKIIKYFDLHTAYANRAMYLVWSQIWASLIFSEVITLKNIIGMLIVMTGVIMVSTDNAEKEVA